MIEGFEEIKSSLQRSKLYKKGLCDYVVNVATGCKHGCSFCYVPSTPAIRMRGEYLREAGVPDPQMAWGDYLLIRKEAAANLTLNQKWHTTPAGRGVVLLSSTTDPYQDLATAAVTREVVSVLLDHRKRVRILTRSPLWLKDLDLLVHPDVTVGMSLPHLDSRLSRSLEPNAPLPYARLKALTQGRNAGCRVFVAIAPTMPEMGVEDFRVHLERVMACEPEVIFWEPINPRGSNKQRMLDAGFDLAMDKRTWAANFLRQWEAIETAAEMVGCKDRLHIWPDPQLAGSVQPEKLDFWISKPTVEIWRDV